MGKFKILIINLEKNKERKEKLEKQFKAYSISNYEFIEAIDGSLMIDELVPMPFGWHRHNVGEKYAKHFKNEEIACLKSHIKAIKRAQELNLDFVVILEDDVIICEDWNKRLSKLLSLTPKKWNHIFLSGLLNEREKQTQFMPLNFAPFLHIEKSRITMGAFSYILKNEIFNIVKNSFSLFNQTTDNVIEELMKANLINSYTFYPFLSYHDNDIKSEIWGEKYNLNHESIRYFVKNM